MKIIVKLQEGDIVARQDNTRVVKSPIPERIKAKPRQYYFVDLGGEPSNDNRTSEERNRDYWHPLKGAKERFKASMKNGGSLVSDGRRFKFKDSPLVRNSKSLNNKRDMRRKFIKSDRPTYSRVRRGQDGLKFVSYQPVDTPILEDNKFEFATPEVFSSYNIPTVRDEVVTTPVKEEVVEVPKTEEEPVMKRELFSIKPSKGLEEFNKWYDEVEKEDPEAKNYRQFLTKMAEQESGFDSRIQNRAGAPAYGYFQFMQDGKKYNNISAYAGTDIETFRNNPKLQIKAAIKLAKAFERGFNKKDLELAAQKGYTKFGLLGGAWLAGNGGVRRYLQGLDNPSDKHWSKSGAGTSVADRIAMFNF